MNRFAEWILRASVAFAFAFPAIDAFWNPDSWFGYFPHFLRGFVPDMVLLHSFGTLELAIAVWILSGRSIFWPSALASVMLVAIVVFDNYQFEILFRDLAIAGAAAALALQNWPWNRVANTVM